MGKFNLGSTSVDRLYTCHIDLILVAKEAIKVSDVDFGISEGNRSLKRQKLLFDAGKSKIDGITKKGNHNYSPSRAFDVYAYVNGKASWRESYLAYLGGVIMGTANRLYEEVKIKHKIRWGGNWDMDGEIITDQSFIDMPHFELYKE